MIATLRATWCLLVLLIATPIFSGLALFGALFRMKDGIRSPFDLAPRLWGRTMLWAAGVRTVEHGRENKEVAQHIFAANHTGNFDVLALAARLRWIKFVAKAELFRIPILGKAMLAAGMIPIERANRRSSFGSFTLATERVAAGASVAVYPEGTRGTTYPLRPFKKGPFVLAIQAQAPVVPLLVYGAIEVQKKGEFKVRPGTIHLHYLPAIPTTGLTEADRGALARRTYEAMAQCLQEIYGIASPPYGTSDPVS